MAKGDVKKQTMVIEYVDPQPGDPWTGGKSPMWFPECRFADGSIGSGFAFSPSGAAEWIAAMQAVVDTAVEFELEDNDTWNGKQKWKIKDFPGKPANTGGGGARNSSASGMSHVQVGTMAAASVMGPILATQEGGLMSPELVAANVQEVADILIDWLFKRRGGQTEEAQNGDAPVGEAAGEVSAAPAPAPSEVLSLAQLRQLRKLGADKGLADNDAIAAAAGVDSLQALTPDDADLLIEAWSAS